jgi:glycosyltransferase involved in cell wall biosynthesis
MISVIIPVYNTPREDICNCFTSIVNQQDSNWEAVVIDDGSREETARYLDEWQRRDERFKVFHKKNAGVSAARNDGIARCTGEYIAFCDADDSLSPDFFKEAGSYILKYNLDMVIGSTCVWNHEKCEVCGCRNNQGIPWIYEKNGIHLLLDYMLSTYCRTENEELQSALVGRVYSRLCRADVLRKASFETDVHLHEDNLFSYDLMIGCKRIGVVDTVWYNYISRTYSLVHQKAGMDSAEQEFLSAVLWQKRKEDGSKHIANAMDLRILQNFMNVCSCLSSRELRGEREKIIQRIFESIFFMEAWKTCSIKGYKDIPLKKRIFVQTGKFPSVRWKKLVIRMMIFARSLLAKK